MIDWTRYEDIRAGGRARPRHIYAATKDPRHVGYMAVWQGAGDWYHEDGHMHVYGRFSDRTLVDRSFPVPAYMAAAFEAREPAEPLLDYLLETYAGECPWLPAAVARLLGEPE